MPRSGSGQRILVDTPHEILVDKLCALLGRSELRDLSDVAHLLGAGGDLERGLAEVAGLDADAVRRLASFRDDLVDRITKLARPGG